MSAITPESIRTPSENGGSVHKWSCTVCASRKVKCDKKDPICGHCAQRGDPCIYKAPPPPKRRKRKAADTEPAEAPEHRVLLPGNTGISSTCTTTYPSPADAMSMVLRGPQEQQYKNGAILVSRKGESRYLENNLWMALGDEINNDEELLDDSPQRENKQSNNHNPGEMIFGTQISTQAFDQLLFRSPQTTTLLQAFIDNVNPMFMIQHAPTLRKLTQDRWTSPEQSNAATDALLYSVFLAGAMSLRIADERAKIGDVLVSDLENRYSEACRQSLMRADLLSSSNIRVLQALVIYVTATCAAQRLDANSLYAFSGIAVRTALRLGVHRDGKILNLPPFETEMRRRLWWTTFFMDIRMAEMAGAGFGSVAAHHYDCCPPTNCNDEDIFPGMQEAPVAQEGATEMMFVLLRASIASFVKRPNDRIEYGGSWHRLVETGIPGVHKSLDIGSLEKQLEDRFLRYCDPLNPLHTLVSTIARSAMCKMKIISRHRPRSAEENEALPQSEKDFIFSTSLKMIGYHNFARVSPTMRCFWWFIKSHLQWHSVIFLLKELQHRPEGIQVDNAWWELDGVFTGNPDILDNPRVGLYRAVVILCRKAWKAREEFFQQNDPPLPERPPFVQKIFASSMPQVHLPEPVVPDQSQQVPPANFTFNFQDSNCMDFFPPIAGDPLSDAMGIDWLDWNTMMPGFSVQ